VALLTGCLVAIPLGPAVLAGLPVTTLWRAHVSGSRGALIDLVAQVDGAARARDRWRQQREVRRYGATVEHVLPAAEHDRVHPEVKPVD
jgi:hypothetical protein